MSSGSQNHSNSLPDASCSRPLGRLFLNLAVLTVIAGAWSSSAEASCGHYLFRNGKPVDSTTSQIIRGEANGESRPDSSTSPAENPVSQCHGPNCSGRPVPVNPLPVTPPHLVRGFDQAAILASLFQWPPLSCAPEIPESERGASCVPSLIFRPPTF